MAASAERFFMSSVSSGSSDGLLKALNDSQRYLDIVHKSELSKSEAEWLIDTTVSNFANYYNSGFIEYRKSVAEAGDFAAVEWTGRGATFKDVSGREYIDCLGGFGLFNLGWAHPKVVGAVQAQLQKSPLPTQELLDPLRAMLAHLLAEVTPDDFWPRLRQICDEYEVLLIADEVQTGMGRTGKLWGVEHWNVAPDIITSAKALGGGVMPIGAFMSTPKIWSVLNSNPFIHTSTTGGNPLACAAAIAAINVTLEEGIVQQAAEKGDYFIRQLKDIAARYSDVYTQVTGKGLLIGQHFVNDDIGYAVASGLFKRGVLISGTLNNSRVVRV